MLKYIFKRILQMLVVLFMVSIIVFVVMSFTGDPALMIVPPQATDAQIEAARVKLGLDKPLLHQYLIFIGNVLRGDFGVSYVFQQPAMKLILSRMPATLEMVVLSMVIAGVVAVPLGAYAGAYPKRKSSKVIMAGSLLGISLPSFWIGMMLILVFAVGLQILPSSGRGDVVHILGMRLSLFSSNGWRYLLLPSITLSIGSIAMLLRLTRAGMMEVVRQDYIKFARAKGVAQRIVLFRHALKNALIPVITIYGLQFGTLIAFATITETIFAWPGMGKLLIDSINVADRPVIVAYLMLVAFMFVIINFVVDVLYTIIDPRIELR